MWSSIAKTRNHRKGCGNFAQGATGRLPPSLPAEAWSVIAGQQRDGAGKIHICWQAVLGGIDWNVTTTASLKRLGLPVSQVADWGTEGGQYFEVTDNGTTTQHRPILAQAAGRTVLREDVALFARAVSPFNRLRTVTMCNGMYGRGTYGAVRALTGEEFRDRNADFLRKRFGDCDAYCLLTRVPVVDGKTLTPDWTADGCTLLGWSR